MLTMMLLLGCQTPIAPRGDASIKKMDNGNYEVSAAMMDKVNQDFLAMETAKDIAIFERDQCKGKLSEKTVKVQ